MLSQVFPVSAGKGNGVRAPLKAAGNSREVSGTIGKRAICFIGSHLRFPAPSFSFVAKTMQASAEEVKAERQHQKAKANPTREQTKQQIQKICYALLEKYKGTGITGHSMFLYDLNKSGVTIERLKNKQGKIYGLKFSYCGQTFKASEIGREFAYRSLQKNFEAGKKADTNKSDQVIRKSSKHTDTKDAGYQLVPPSRSYTPQPTKETPKIAQTIRDMADAAISTADDLVEGVGGMFAT